VPAGIRRLALGLLLAPIVGLLAAQTALAAMDASVSTSSQPPDVTNFLITNTGDVPFSDAFFYDTSGGTVTGCTNPSGTCSVGGQLADFDFAPNIGGGSSVTISINTNPFPPESLELRLYGNPSGELDYFYRAAVTRPPDAHSFVLRAYALFKHDKANGRVPATVSAAEPDFDLVHASLRSKTIRIGSLADTHIRSEEQRVVVPVHLSGKGLRLLESGGKLKVTVHGTLRNRFGNTAYTSKLRLVARK
jgi:hypothetical protein